MGYEAKGSVTTRLDSLEDKIDRLSRILTNGQDNTAAGCSYRQSPRSPCSISPIRDSGVSRDISSSRPAPCFRDVGPSRPPSCPPEEWSRSDEMALCGVDRYAVIGELLFQFERRFFNRVMPNCTRYYGYAVRNIEQLIAREEDTSDRVRFRNELNKLNEKLRCVGYLPYYHAELSCSVINEYGVLSSSAGNPQNALRRLEDEALLRRLIRTTIPASLKDDVLKLLDCLLLLRDEDGGRIFQY